MEWAPYSLTKLILAIAYFTVASVDTFDTRLIQAKRDGRLPPDQQMLPEWIVIFTWIMWGIFVAMLYVDWRYALTMFVLKFILKVLPVLETIGNILTSPLKRRK